VLSTAPRWWQALHEGTLPFITLQPHKRTTHEHRRTSGLVTGGASGLGEATARELARLGAKVAVLDVNLASPRRSRRQSVASPASATSPAPTACSRAGQGRAAHGPAAS
jgi:hypothetical protein